VLPLWVRDRLALLRFYQSYCTFVVHYCYVTGGVLTSFQISDPQANL